MTRAEPIRILLVEDNADHAELVKRSLNEHRVTNQITHVADGEEALEFLFRRGQHEGRSWDPDLVLLDLRLPRVDGLEVLRQVRSSADHAQIPVVVLTTSEGERDLVDAYQLKANAYVVKPVDFGKFVELMHDLGLFWLAWNRRPPRSS